MERSNKLLLHSCCAPCFTSVFGQVKDNFEVAIFWYNPNIEPMSEHDNRFQTLKVYLNKAKIKNKILADYDYKIENEKWHEFVAGLESEPEGGKRCEKCFEFRLKRTLEMAKELGLEATTTLTVSPYKEAAKINSIGKKIDNDIFLEFDFNKNNGYKRSIEICKEFGLYRQKYCGCRYSIKS